MVKSMIEEAENYGGLRPDITPTGVRVLHECIHAGKRRKMDALGESVELV